MSQDRKSSTDQKDRELESRLAQLERLFILFAQTGTVENTLGHGFDAMSGHLCTLNDRLENLTAELTPLRRLSGPTAPFSDDQRAHLAELLASHARPSFTNIGSLDQGNGSSRFIGDPLPTRDTPTNPLKRRSAP